MPSNQSYIDGKWISGSGRTFKNINPSDTQDIIGEYQECNLDEFNAACHGTPTDGCHRTRGDSPKICG
jgi:acyl-CoA reductase-like NAD-dependent aldehyde dehydrogenase